MKKERWTADDICRGCGYHAGRHEVDQYSGRLKCPVFREEKTTPPQEHNRSPRSDY